jgi:hypothetical protein
MSDRWEDVDAAVLEELNDPVHAGKTHYRKATYAAGCRGPLCRKAERDAGRMRTKQKAEAAGREYKPEMRSREEILIDMRLNIWIQRHERARAAAAPPPQRCETCGTRVKEAV